MSIGQGGDGRWLINLSLFSGKITPVSLSGLKNIDFSLILNTMLSQERVPVVTRLSPRVGSVSGLVSWPDATVAHVCLCLVAAQ